MNHRRWNVLPPPPNQRLAEMVGLHPLLVQLLYNRGIAEPDQIAPFLAADRQLHCDPLLLPDIEEAVARIYRALLSGENIAVYGDFDVDGVCGTALLVQGLSLLGAKAIPYIPHRIDEGYGPNSAALEGLSRNGITLVITVDCGISSTSEVEHARRMGLDIIVTDHHSVPAELPPAVAVIDPCRTDCAYPFPQMAGVGVAFKLLEALFQSLGREDGLDELLDLVVLGTVADIMPLVGENRYLAKHGLRMLNRTERLGLQEMVRIAGLQLGSLDIRSISYVLGPRLNAAGRLGHAINSYRLLLTDSAEEAYFLARELEQKNALRQRLTNTTLARAKEELSDTGAPLLLVGGEGYHSGIVGLVASKLVNEFYRPTLVFELDRNTVRGSARSIPEFNITDALGECQDLLMRFGGHPGAAGFTLPADNLSLFQQRLLDIAASQLSGIDLQPTLTVDAEIPLSTLNGNVLNAIDRLAPFGHGNPLPTFLSREVSLAECHQAGKNREHLKLKLRQDEMVWRGIGFDLGHLVAEVTPSLDIVYNLRVDRWGSEEVLALNILDFAPAD